MLQLRVAKVWMLADGRPESQGRVLWVASRCVLRNDEWFDPNLLCQCQSLLMLDLRCQFPNPWCPVCCCQTDTVQKHGVPVSGKPGQYSYSPFQCGIFNEWDTTRCCCSNTNQMTIRVMLQFVHTEFSSQISQLVMCSLSVDALHILWKPKILICTFHSFELFNLFCKYFILRQ